ncbi:MAG: Ig-like domain-containing protein [Pseudomonadota bacterium]
MRAASWLAIPLLFTACPLTTFEVEPGNGSGGAGPAPSSNGASAGTVLPPTGGTGSVPRIAIAPKTLPDRYVVAQGQQLVVPAPGVLANDTPRDLEVIRVSEVRGTRPAAYDAERVDIRPDGALEFVPESRFFGVYRLEYVVENGEGAKATGTVEIHVPPSEIHLADVAAGLGGIVISGRRGEGLGLALDRAGDVNRDGLADLIVGAPNARDGAGNAYLVFGRTELRSTALSDSPAGEALQQYAVLRGAPGSAAGRSVSGISDLDGDGTADVVIGAPGGGGKAYLVRTSGLTGTVVLDEMTAERGIILEGDEDAVAVGEMVRGLGDVTGDGTPDVAVTSVSGGTSAVHIVSGASALAGGGLAEAALLLADEWSADTPRALAGVGDVNGDGFADVLVASNENILLLHGGLEFPASSGLVSIDGSAYGYRLTRVFPGVGASVAGLGDVDGNGLRDFVYCEAASYCRVVFGPPSTLATGWNVSGFGEGGKPLLAALAGDVDGDRVPDLVLAEETVAYVVFGKRGDFADLSVGAAGTARIRVRVPEGGAFTAVAAAGDMNGDRIMDLAFADATANRGAGRVYVVFGVASR